MTLDRYLLKQFFPILCAALFMFMLLLSLIDMFANLVRFLNNEAAPLDILKVSLYYLPKSFSYALPISLLFAAAYTLGDLYSRNELTAVFSSGIPFWRFSIALVFVGLAASVFTFFFDDIAVIPALKLKNDLSRTLLNQQQPESRADIVIKARDGRLVYAADYFDNAARRLAGLSIIELDNDGRLVSLVRSSGAVWTGAYWELSNPVIYEWEGGLLRYRPMNNSAAGRYREEPDMFRRNMERPEELRFRDVRLLVRDLRAAALPVVNALADYYHRFSYSAVSFVIVVVSISMGGRFKKNILLMSLLSSLVSAVVYYVMEMISMMMARLGYIPPLAGAWFPVGVFTALGIILLLRAKT